jgi:hypothetical protein
MVPLEGRVALMLRGLVVPSRFLGALLVHLGHGFLGTHRLELLLLGALCSLLFAGLQEITALAQLLQTREGLEWTLLELIEGEGGFGTPPEVVVRLVLAEEFEYIFFDDLHLI